MIGWIERWLLFRPASWTRFWTEAPPELHAQDVWLSLPRGLIVHGWWCVPENWQAADGAVLYSHGNAGNLSHRGDSILRWLERLRRAVLIYDYPGYGRSTGKPSEAGCYAAGQAALDWIIAERGVAPAEVIFYGASLGGGVAVELATRRPARALVLVSAFSSVPDMAKARYPWLPARPFIRNRFDNLAKIPRVPGRVFIAHGTADRFVPFSMGERLFAAAREPKRFLPMTNYDHHHTPGPDFYNELERFLEQTGSRDGSLHIPTR